MRIQKSCIVFIALATLAGCHGSGSGSGSGPRADVDQKDTKGIVVSEPDHSIAERLVNDWRWHHRLLVVRSDQDSMLTEQASLVGSRMNAWKDREMKLVLLTTNGGLVVDRFVDGGPVGESFTLGVEQELVDRYGLESGREGFSAALVGKDGGVKARWSELVEPDAVFDLVDAMPMRIREVREADE